MPTLCSKKKDHKWQLSLKEACSVAMKMQKKGSARAKKRQKEGWIEVDCNMHKWVLKDTHKVAAGARVLTIKHKATISNVFLSLLPLSVLVNNWKELGKQALFYSTKKVPIADIYKMYAATLFFASKCATCGQRCP